MSTRKTYYKPLLDPAYLAKLHPEERKRQENEDYSGEGEIFPPTEDKPANLVSSLCDDGLHRPALDLDLEARLVPSSTPGHFHLFIDDVALSWTRYLVVLEALVAVGIIEQGYFDASKKRGQTLLRLPHCKKELT